jgi:hypothetical protein
MYIHMETYTEIHIDIIEDMDGGGGV